MSKDVSPSKESITAGQAAKFSDLQVARLRKSGLPSGPTQYVLEHEGAEIADGFVADVRRRVEARIRATEPHILQRKLFDPEQFLGKGWSIDERVGKRLGDNLDAGRIITREYEGETGIDGGEWIRRIKKANPEDIQLDVDDFMALWQEEGQVALKWLYDDKGITFLSFWATILRDPNGDRYVLYLNRHEEDGSWVWSYYGADHVPWRADPTVAALASS